MITNSKTKKDNIVHYLPVKPISVNECWQGRRFKTKKYDAFIKEMLYQMPKEKMLNGLLEVELIFREKSLMRSDLDNKIKPVLDCLKKRGWICDDRYICSIKAIKVKSETGREGIGIIIKQIYEK